MLSAGVSLPLPLSFALLCVPTLARTFQSFGMPSRALTSLAVIIKCRLCNPRAQCALVCPCVPPYASTALHSTYHVSCSVACNRVPFPSTFMLRPAYPCSHACTCWRPHIGWSANHEWNNRKLTDDHSDLEVPKYAGFAWSCRPHAVLMHRVCRGSTPPSLQQVDPEPETLPFVHQPVFTVCHQTLLYVNEHVLRQSTKSKHANSLNQGAGAQVRAVFCWEQSAGHLSDSPSMTVTVHVLAATPVQRVRGAVLEAVALAGSSMRAPGAKAATDLKQNRLLRECWQSYPWESAGSPAEAAAVRAATLARMSSLLDSVDLGAGFGFLLGGG